MEENKKLFEDVHNYTKYKLVDMLIKDYKDKKLDNLNLIEELADRSLAVLAVCGLKFHNELEQEFGDED